MVLVLVTKAWLTLSSPLVAVHHIQLRSSGDFKFHVRYFFVEYERVVQVLKHGEHLQGQLMSLDTSIQDPLRLRDFARLLLGCIEANLCK